MATEESKSLDPRIMTILIFLEDYEADLKRPEAKASWQSHEEGARELLSRLEGKEREVPSTNTKTPAVNGVVEAWTERSAA